MTSTKSASVITILKSIFSRHGIPEVVCSDRAHMQFTTSKEFCHFTKQYGFHQVASSSHYLQSNGAVERMVQTVKGMLKKSSDPHLARIPTDLEEDVDVWVMRTDGQTTEGRVVGPAGTPISYIVEMPAGEVRRNQSQLTVIPSSQPYIPTAAEQLNKQTV